MQNKNYSGPQLGPRWATQVSSQPSYMHANIKISVGPNWAPDGLAQMGSPLGTHLKTVAKVNWAPSGLPTWGPSDSPSGPHLWPSCTCWLGNHCVTYVAIIFVSEHVQLVNYYAFTATFRIRKIIRRPKFLRNFRLKLM